MDHKGQPFVKTEPGLILLALRRVDLHLAFDVQAAKVLSYLST